MMKKICCTLFMLALSTLAAESAEISFSQTDLIASEYAKKMMQNESYFKGLTEAEQAAVCTGAIISYQVCLQGDDSEEQVLEGSKYLFGQIYGDWEEYEAFVKAGQIYGIMLSKTTQDCASVEHFTNGSCQDMMAKNMQFVQKNFKIDEKMKEYEYSPRK